METIRDRKNEIKLKGYELDFNKIFNESIENYKKIALNAGLTLLMFTIVMATFTGGLIGGFYGFSSILGTLTDFGTATALSGTTILVMLSTIIISVIIAPFNAGIIKMAHLAQQNMEFSITNVLDYYKDPCLRELLIATAITSASGIILNTLLNTLGIIFMGTLTTYIISFFTFLVIPLIIFGKSKAIDAISTSFVVVSKNILVLLGLLIVAIIMSCSGLIGFCIGIFFTLPFIFSMYYIIYINIFDIKLDSEIEDIGTFQE